MCLAAVEGAVLIGCGTHIGADSDARLDELSVGECALTTDHSFGMLEGRTIADPFIKKGIVDGVGIYVALPTVGSGACGAVLDIEFVGACHFGGAERRFGLAAATAAGIQSDVAVEDLFKLAGKLGRRCKIICVHLTGFCDMRGSVNLVEIRNRNCCCKSCEHECKRCYFLFETFHLNSLSLCSSLIITNHRQSVY